MISHLKINEEAAKRYYERGWWTSETLCDAWNTQAQTFAERPYVKDDQGTSYTYAQTNERACRLASWLSAQGVKNGDVVSFQIPKWAEFCVMYVACLKIGAVMHPLPVNYNAADLLYALNLVQSSAYIFPTFYHGTDYEALYRGIACDTPSLKAALAIDKTRPASQVASLSHVIAHSEPFDAPCPSRSDDVACILATSGTTGHPKQVLFTHNNILFSERSYASVLDLSCEDIAWMPSPLNHATGFYHGLIATMLTGGSVALEQHFSAEEAVALINREGCTWSHGATPFVFDLLNYLDATGESLPSLRFYLCGGAPVPSTMIAHAAKHDILLCESYGSTESCPHIYVPLSSCLEWNGRFSGIPYEGIEVRAVDENRNPVACGKQGEECSRGPHQFVGYLNDPQRTDAALDDEGWFYSGDLCTIDSQGRVKITGRKKEIIIRGGENISSHEVDAALTGCPGIGNHATIGMPDDRMGERICTFAVSSGDTRPCLRDIQDYLKGIGVQKRLWPERIEYIDEIPLTKTGKVKRYMLQEELRRRMESPQGTIRKGMEPR